MLKHTGESLKSIMGPGHLDPLTKELVYVAISITNNSENCMASHTAAARAKGATDAQINELYAVVGLANMTNRLANAYKVPVDAQFKDTA
jgi:AhpD family alkylhydroperoxidase